MKVVHRIEIVARCPFDQRGDVYVCEVHAERVIPVEDIISAADEAAGMVIYQEDLAEWMRNKLRARIVLRGTHFGRVTTEVVAE
jgi:hypothetical protein